MLISTELDLVETALDQAVSSDVSLLAEASRHIIRSGGKRLRPRILLLGYLALGGSDSTQAVRLATAVELLHTASLVHDDINDDSNLRRGSETANARWGTSLALLIGDFVFVKLLSLLANCDPHNIRVLADCCAAIVEGEAQQMIHSKDLNLTEAGYLQIVSKKTASLISACGELGGLLAGGTAEQVRALAEYGYNLGMAFQIRDDTLDLLGTSEELGKPTGSDLYHGKVDLTAIYAIRHSGEARAILAAKDVKRLIDMLHDTGAFQYAMKKASEYVDRAQGSLDDLPESKAKAELRRLADFTIIRVQ